VYRESHARLVACICPATQSPKFCGGNQSDILGKSWLSKRRYRLITDGSGLTTVVLVASQFANSKVQAAESAGGRLYPTMTTLFADRNASAAIFHILTNTGLPSSSASQLGDNLDAPGMKSDFGIVAISLSRVFTKGNLVCFAPEGKGRQVINEALAEMLDENTEQWGLRGFRELHNRIVAVMFHLAAPWDIRGERLTHLSTSNFIETGTNVTGWKTLKGNLENIRRRII
jgi:hypothetical protein